jgi:tetratricopeptide (TPR) repeat protein
MSPRKYMGLILFLLLVVQLQVNAQDLLTAGREALERGEYAEAERLFRQQVAKTPQSAEALSNLGAVLAREQKFDEAIETYERALRADPKLTGVYFNLGVAYFKAGRYQAAAAPFETFLKSRPADPRARQLLAVSLVESAQYRRGIALLEQLAKEQPNDPSILFALAGAHIRAGDQEQGKLLLQQLETSKLPPASTHLLQGMLYYRGQHYDDSEKELQEAVRLDPQSAPALAALGRLRLRVNDDSAAIGYFERALAIQPQDAESNYQLGVLLGRNGAEERGRHYLIRAMEQRANYPDPMYFLAKMDLNDNHPAQAVKLLERAVQLAPDTESVRFLLARAYKQAGKDDLSKAQLAEFRRLQHERLQRDRKAMDPERPDPTQPMSTDKNP